MLCTGVELVAGRRVRAPSRPRSASLRVSDTEPRKSTGERVLTYVVAPESCGNLQRLQRELHIGGPAVLAPRSRYARYGC